ncbi:MAG: glycosyltransferase family 1 protein [candidate division WOR-3 bacterium]|nr:glycosyltransferase family 1 protein [candidate division WOR-3 bacterium]
MRMLVSAPFDTRAYAGISLYIRSLVPHLAEHCDLSILTPDPHILCRYGRAIEIPDGVRYPVRRMLWVLTRLRAYCREKYDVLLCLTPGVPVPTLLPTIAVVHDLTPLKIRGLNPIKEKTSFWVGLQTLRFADRVVTDSHCTRGDLAAMNLLPRRRATVAFCGPGIVPSGEDTDYAKRFVPYVLYVGSHAPHKNVIRLIHSFARVRAERNLKLVLVGSGSEEQLGHVARTVRADSIQSRVIILSGVSDAQLSSLYQHCRLLVCPSVYEGFGLPVLEAMLHGAPVACSAVASLPEVAGGAALLFDPYSVRDMADKLQTLLDSPGLVTRLSEIGRNRATLFTWERTARTIYECATGLA